MLFGNRLFFVLSVVAVLALLVFSGAGAPHDSGAIRDSEKELLIQQKNQVEQIRAKAEQGDAQAQFMLGVIYRDGGGDVEQDDKQAAAWYRKAAEQGLRKAQANLGVMYFRGEGVRQDYKQAATWLTKAAEQGSARAQYHIGMMYLDGIGVRENNAQAYMWIKLAAAQRFGDAEYFLGSLEKSLRSWEIEEGQRLAREWRAAHPQAGGGEDP